jgi:hypothetical protein
MQDRCVRDNDGARRHLQSCRLRASGGFFAK